MRISYTAFLIITCIMGIALMFALAFTRKGQHVKTYILRDVFTGKIYRVCADSAKDAKWKVATLKKINTYNLAHVRPQGSREYA